MEVFDNNILVKKATLEDVSKIVAIHKKCVLITNAQIYPKKVIKEWTKQINTRNTKDQMNNSLWFVIKEKNKIIGFCQFSIEEKALYQINILPKYQNKKYGKLLYNFVEKQFLKNKIKKIYLNSTLNAVTFYEKLGFRKIEWVKFKLDKTAVKMLRMEKHLKQE